jgi:alpha-tubulin suppressor-like RCC1 family protein
MTCAQTTGSARCWGDNFYGQLGDGTTVARRSPATVKSLAASARPAAGADHACALVGGEVHCWGDNSLGQLGNGTFSVSLTPVDVVFP